jgi:CelD/BcsL family acetyltransferase involved in cellulose biosynthesis
MAEKSADLNPIVAAQDDPRLALASTSAAGVWIEIHDRLASVETLWRAFETSADCTVFQRFDYLAAWQRHVGERTHSRPLIVVMRGHGEEVLCLLPLALEGRTLRWLGQDNSDYCAPLLESDFERRIDAKTFPLLWAELCEALNREDMFRFDIADLRKMPETVSGQRNPMLALAALPNPSNAHLTNLTGDWEKYYSEKRSSSTRRRDRTKLKRLGEFGEVRMITPESDAELRATFDGLIEQKSAALARMGAHNLFADPGVRDFYLDLAANARSFVHVSKLQVGGVQASTNLGFEHRGRYYYVLASYDAGETSRFGPGAAHLRALMERAIQRGLHEFDFTIGDERYKSEWADVELHLFDHIAAQGWRGLVPAFAKRIELRLRRAIKQNGWLWASVLKFRALMGRSRAPDTSIDTDK